MAEDVKVSEGTGAVEDAVEAASPPPARRATELHLSHVHARATAQAIDTCLHYRAARPSSDKGQSRSQMYDSALVFAETSLQGHPRRRAAPKAIQMLLELTRLPDLGKAHQPSE